METTSSAAKKPEHVDEQALLIIGAICMVLVAGIWGWSFWEALSMRQGLRTAARVSANVVRVNKETTGSGKNRRDHYYLHVQPWVEPSQVFPVETGFAMYRLKGPGSHVKILRDPLGDFEWVVDEDPWHLSRPCLFFNIGLMVFVATFWMIPFAFFGPRAKSPWTIKPDGLGPWVISVAAGSFLPIGLLFLFPELRSGKPLHDTFPMILGLVLATLGAIAMGIVWQKGVALTEPPAPEEIGETAPDDSPSRQQPQLLGGSPDPYSPFRPARIDRFHVMLFLASVPGWCAFGLATLNLGDALVGAMVLAGCLAWWRLMEGVSGLKEVLEHAWRAVDEAKPSTAEGLAGTWSGAILWGEAKALVLHLESAGDCDIRGSTREGHPQDADNSASVEGVYDPKLGMLAFFIRPDKPNKPNISCWGLVIGPHSIEGTWNQAKGHGRFFVHRSRAEEKHIDRLTKMNKMQEAKIKF